MCFEIIIAKQKIYKVYLLWLEMAKEDVASQVARSIRDGKPFTVFFYTEVPKAYKKYFKETPDTSQQKGKGVPENSGKKIPRSLSIQFANKDIVSNVKESFQDGVEAVVVYAGDQKMEETKKKLKKAGMLSSKRVWLDLQDEKK